MTEDDFQSRQAGVSAEIAGWHLAQFVRAFLRASLGDGNPNRTTSVFLEFADALRATEKISVRDVILAGFEEMALLSESDDLRTRTKVDLTRSAVQYYVERTCDDPAAAARASSRWRHVLQDIEELDRLRRTNAEWARRVPGT